MLKDDSKISQYFKFTPVNNTPVNNTQYTIEMSNLNVYGVEDF